MTMSETQREAAHGLDRVTRFQGENATMNSPFMPLQSAADTTSLIHTSIDAAGVDVLLAETGAMPDIEAARGGPPPPLLEQIAAAAEIERALSASGRAVRFCTDPAGGRTAIELCEEGAAPRPLTAGETAALAAGESLG